MGRGGGTHIPAVAIGPICRKNPGQLSAEVQVDLPPPRWKVGALRHMLVVCFLDIATPPEEAPFSKIISAS